MSQLTTLAKARRVAPVLLLAALAACSKQDETAPPNAAPATAAANAPAPPPVSAKVQSMGTEQLHDSASQALRENRMYAPAGNNAVEYYLALRDKQPDDAGVKSALTDLMPYTLIAAEQSINREDFPEAQRLIGLIEKMDPQAPALPRLKQGVSKGMEAVAQRSQDETDKAKKDAEQKAKLAAEQQKQAQQQASEAQAAQQIAAQQEAARRESARQEAERQAAARPATPAATAQPTPAPAATPAAAPASAATAQTLRPISTPAPRYPPEALRSGTAGEVLVEITVGTDGAVTNARVLRSTPPRVFDREALNATKRWRFEPVSAPITTRRTLAFNPGG
ncbi:energy transducer TonB [Xanthomonas sp. A2111]|uniref:Protein TonB n=1 Tax=Xanthomonas hawaiiensis TaxID=3003247 RepID=A0ABU2I5R9_9XANT|nr:MULTISPECIES: energy transducer TonB [unclassified Xanthomonas]MBO9829798.1 energy transducer TonB [Xanthomonas sp. A2111]MBO9873436.1 energy transducer TonB [Xanthomonas sp. D-93]MDS9993489.1 energy transducer TonB [Xanthomonas sp. A2111]WNH45221.1 energy transducer TonB [Xanthomonas sp. A6251]